MRYVYVLPAAMSLALLAAVAGAAGYGTSMITLSAYNVSIAQGGSYSVTYNVNLTSGGTWGSTVNILNGAELASKGISVRLSVPTGEPPFSGSATVNVGSGTAAGLYKASLNVSGDDPSVNTAILGINVLAPVNNTITTTIASSVPTSIVTTVPVGSTTANYQNGYGPGSGSGAKYAIAAIVVLVIIVVALVIIFATRRR